MSFSGRRPTQQLNINCTNCGVVTVRFESFVADGRIFEMVGTKLSEMMALISASPEVVLCTACATKAASEAETRRLRKRERIQQQMELRPTVPTVSDDSDLPATYPQTDSQRKRDTRIQADSQGDVVTVRPEPRRAFSSREPLTSSRPSAGHKFSLRNKLQGWGNALRSMDRQWEES